MVFVSHTGCLAHYVDEIDTSHLSDSFSQSRAIDILKPYQIPLYIFIIKAPPKHILLISRMYAADIYSREELRRCRRERAMRQQKTRRTALLLLTLTLIAVFGIGFGFGTLMTRAEEPADSGTYKYYSNIEILPGDTPHLIGIDDKRIALYRLGGIGFGTEVIFKAQLGYGTVKVGVGQIGLHLYDTVEVLYGQDIIFKIEGVASDVSNALGIKLRHNRPQTGNEQEEQKKLSAHILDRKIIRYTT